MTGPAQDVLTVGSGTLVSFNELVRCCDEPWAPHSLVIENVGETPGHRDRTGQRSSTTTWP
jgi:hypothetical protein